MPGSYADAQPRVWTPSFYVGLLIDEAVEYNKQHPKTYNLEEAKVEVRRRIAEKLADREL